MTGEQQVCPEFRWHSLQKHGAFDLYTQSLSTSGLIFSNESFKHNHSICDTSWLLPEIKMHDILQLCSERAWACERGLYVRARSRNACTPLGCCRMICSAGPLVNMTSRYLSCASMSWFRGSLAIRTLACAASSAASIIRPSWRSTTDT